MSGGPARAHAPDAAPLTDSIVFFDVDDTLATRAMGSYVAILLEAIDDVLGIRPAVTVCGADTYLDGQRVTGVTTGALSLHAAALTGLDADASFAAAAAVAERTAYRYRAACATGAVVLGRELPGAVRTLTSLHAAGWRLGAATGRIAACGRMTLTHLGVEHLFDVDARSDLAVDKAAAMTAACLAELAHGRHVDVRHCAIVGDAEADMAAAFATGALGIGVTTGSRTPAQLLAAGASVVLDDLAGADAAARIGAALLAHQRALVGHGDDTRAA